MKKQIYIYIIIFLNNSLLIDESVITVAICLEFRSRHESSVTILSLNDDDEKSFCLVTKY
jgi:hypothetical protein